MDNEDDCLPDLSTLSEADKDDYIVSLHEGVHEQHETAQYAIHVISEVAAVAESMATIAEATNAKGHRRQGLNILEAKLTQLSIKLYAMLGITPEARDEAEQFMDIIGPLEQEGLGKGIE